MKFVGIKLSKDWATKTPFSFNGKTVGYFSYNVDPDRPVTLLALGPIGIMTVDVTFKKDTK